MGEKDTQHTNAKILGQAQPNKTQNEPPLEHQHKDAQKEEAQRESLRKKQKDKKEANTSRMDDEEVLALAEDLQNATHTWFDDHG